MTRKTHTSTPLPASWLSVRQLREKGSFYFLQLQFFCQISVPAASPPSHQCLCLCPWLGLSGSVTLSVSVSLVYSPSHSDVNTSQQHHSQGRQLPSLGPQRPLRRCPLFLQHTAPSGRPRRGCWQGLSPCTFWKAPAFVWSPSLINVGCYLALFGCRMSWIEGTHSASWNPCCHCFVLVITVHKSYSMSLLFIPCLP